MAEVLGVLFIVLFAFLVLRRICVISRMTLYEYEKGLCYKRGRFVKILEPGVYWHWKLITTIRKYDIRKKDVTIPGQELLTSDGIVIKISLSAEYGFEDLAKAVNQYEDYYQAVYLEIQSVSRTIIGNLKAEELLEKRNEISQNIFNLVKEKASTIGLVIYSLDIKDIMFPGTLKDIFAQVLKAQKQSQAELERARGQMASLRLLANAAKMMDNNPSLLNLRLIQAASEGTGNTIVLKMADDSTIEVQQVKKT